jgi:hypothetical protein
MFLRLALLACLFSSATAQAEEGMWLPNQTAAIGPAMRAAGLELDPAKLGDLTQPPLTAIASLGGCSAAFLSASGLIATNHHCVYGSIQYNSTPERDYLTNGFTAKTLADELPTAPGTRVFVIEDLRDVTADMTRGLKIKMSGLERFNRIDANRKKLIADCEKQPSRRCDVRAYFGGATYYLQQQLEIKDVRLVYAPSGGVGNFGGETDNWQWPRHTGDWGFYRAYVAPDGSSAVYDTANVPFRPQAHLTIASQGVKEGDFVMVAGFPGVTSRLATAAEASFHYGQFAPLDQKLRSDYAALIAAATEGDAGTQIKYASIIRGVENYKKKILGEIAGAEAIDLNGRKARDEAAYRNWIKADPSREKIYGPAATALDAIILEEQAAAIDSLRTATLGRAQLLASARTAYRFAKEREKPDEKRESGYQDRDRQLLTDASRQVERRFDPRIDRAILEAALEIYRQTPETARNAVFEAKLAEIGIDRLYADTKLGDTPTRLAWLDQPASAFEASADPFTQLAVALYPGDIAAEAKRKDRAGRMQAARSAYMRGQLAFAEAEGRSMYPDANGSLRFTYGHVKGRARDGVIWTPFTTAEGFLAKQTGRGEFNAPQHVIAAMEAKDWGMFASPELGTLPIDFLSTVDITNGNSGSSTLNAKGEFVGLAFDGTLDGVIADWSFDSTINRTIHVDSRFMLWSMAKTDDAEHLLKEMGVN